MHTCTWLSVSNSAEIRANVSAGPALQKSNDMACAISPPGRRWSSCLAERFVHAPQSVHPCPAGPRPALAAVLPVQAAVRHSAGSARDIPLLAAKLCDLCDSCDSWEKDCSLVQIRRLLGGGAAVCSQMGVSTTGSRAKQSYWLLWRSRRRTACCADAIGTQLGEQTCITAQAGGTLQAGALQNNVVPG